MPPPPPQSVNFSASITAAERPSPDPADPTESRTFAPGHLPSAYLTLTLNPDHNVFVFTSVLNNQTPTRDTDEVSRRHDESHRCILCCENSPSDTRTACIELAHTAAEAVVRLDRTFAESVSPPGDPNPKH